MNNATKGLPKLLNAWAYYVKHAPRKLMWQVLYRLHPKHRYHIPRHSLTPGYYDCDTRITNTLFEEVCYFVKISNTDWTTHPEHVKAWQAFNRAAHWWKVGRITFLSEAESYWETEYEELHSAANLIEDVIVPRRDKELLIGIITFLEYMWD